MTYHTHIKLPFIFLFLFAALSSSSQDKPSAFALFESDSIANVKMITDLKLLVKNTRAEIYQPAIIRIMYSSGDSSSYDVKIKSRGNRRKEVCYYPPIKVKFPKDDFTHNKLKWVLTCKSTDAYDQILLKEYMAYQIFEGMTDRSFGTELMKVDYIDTGRDNKTFTRYAFVIENADAVAERLGGRVYSPRVMAATILEDDQLTLYTMFNYLIANTDWAIKNLHNMESMIDSSDAVLIIPYDFDYSGFVGTSYAEPHLTDVPIGDVLERYNKGYCVSEESCEKYRQLFLANKEEILGGCRDFKYFNKKTKKTAENFLKGFFKIMENQKRTHDIFCKDCRTK